MMPRNLLITIALLLVAVVAMGVYGYHLRREALELQQKADARPVAPPVAGTAEKVVLFTPDDARGILLQREVNANLPSEKTARAREVLRLLISAWQDKNSAHQIGAGADVTEVFLIEGKRAIVDVNGIFADQHRSGVLVEELTMASIAKTLAANVPGISELKLIVDGHERETLAGHADLTNFYSTDLQWQTE
ncbi:MAG TPA: hypothetical protein VN577_04210 [Terriglobales bacterium]|nr:hypothetical protein [Terriglobales bacterium]